MSSGEGLRMASPAHLDCQREIRVNGPVRKTGAGRHSSLLSSMGTLPHWKEGPQPYIDPFQRRQEGVVCLGQAAESRCS